MTTDRVEHAAFYIVWCPDGTRPPTVTHGSQQEAEQVADKMARTHNGKRFYVLRAVSEFLADRPIGLTLTELVDIPF